MIDDPFDSVSCPIHINSMQSIKTQRLQLKDPNKFQKITSAKSSREALSLFGLVDREIDSAFSMWPELMDSDNSVHIREDTIEEERKEGKRRKMERVPHLREEVIARLDQLMFLSGQYLESKCSADGNSETKVPTCVSMSPQEAILLVTDEPHYLSRYFRVLRLDSDFLVVDKPHDVRVDVPRDGGHKWSCEVTVADFFTHMSPLSDRVRLCHQLDHATSGVLVQDVRVCRR
eukprot:GHVR01087602.1.p1 GENE.GHVR01087602.1~~GHVR01087602.1.p1  ORF type:complete len:232 (+),score=37.82 GHVR01087602.1:9-704(+)